MVRIIDIKGDISTVNYNKKHTKPEINKIAKEYLEKYSQKVIYVFRESGTYERTIYILERV